MEKVHQSFDTQPHFYFVEYDTQKYTLNILKENAKNNTSITTQKNQSENNHYISSKKLT